jgi:hypothetical protein
MQWLDTQNYLNVTRLKYAKRLGFPFSLVYLSSHRKYVRNIIMRDAPIECTVEEKSIEVAFGVWSGTPLSSRTQ